jgi:hypothetical protein
VIGAFAVRDALEVMVADWNRSGEIEWMALRADEEKGLEIGWRWGQLRLLEMLFCGFSLVSCGAPKTPSTVQSNPPESAASPAPAAGPADPVTTAGSDVFAGRWLLKEATCAGTPVALGANPESLQIEPSRLGRVTVEGDPADRTCKVAVAYGMVREAFASGSQKVTLTPRAQRRVCRNKQDQVVSERTEQISGTAIAAELRVTNDELRVDSPTWPLCAGAVGILRFARAP